MNATIDTVLRLCPPPHPHPHPPTRFRVPLGAVDTHAHVVGESFVPERSYTPPPAPPRNYLAMLDATTMTYGVVVQVSVHTRAEDDVRPDAPGVNRDRAHTAATQLLAQ